MRNLAKIADGGGGGGAILCGRHKCMVPSLRSSCIFENLTPFPRISREFIRVREWGEGEVRIMG